jgi:hypothetical protein
MKGMLIKVKIEPPYQEVCIFVLEIINGHITKHFNESINIKQYYLHCPASGVVASHFLSKGIDRFST